LRLRNGESRAMVLGEQTRVWFCWILWRWEFAFVAFAFVSFPFLFLLIRWAAAVYSTFGLILKGNVGTICCSFSVGIVPWTGLGNSENSPVERDGWSFVRIDVSFFRNNWKVSLIIAIFGPFWPKRLLSTERSLFSTIPWGFFVFCGSLMD